jgi:colicin import membrane protein
VTIPNGTPLNAEVEFSVIQQPNGEVIEVTLKQSSGFQEYDQAMERAIREASPLPSPPLSEIFTRDLVLKLTPNERIPAR